jgi:hypothetical protein
MSRRIVEKPEDIIGVTLCHPDNPLMMCSGLSRMACVLFTPIRFNDKSYLQ